MEVLVSTVKALVQIVLLLFLAIICLSSAVGQTVPLSERMAATAMTIWKDALAADPARERWNYEQGVLLKGIEGVWLSTGDGKYFRYIQHITDRFINDDGTIRTYRPEEYNIDTVLPGRNLLLLYKVTGQEKYRKAAEAL